MRRSALLIPVLLGSTALAHAATVTVYGTVADAEAQTVPGQNPYIHTIAYSNGSKIGGADYAWSPGSTLAADNCAVLAIAGGGGRYLIDTHGAGITPEQCGAYKNGAPDGSAGHDDSAAIELAVVAVSNGHVQPSTGATYGTAPYVQGTAGIYAVGATVKQQSFVRMTGAGMGVTRIQALTSGSFNNGIFSNTVGPSNVTNFTLDNLSIYGSVPQTGTNTAQGPDCFQVSNGFAHLTIDRVECAYAIFGLGGQGGAMADINVTNSYLHNLAKDGIAFWNTSGLRVSHNYLEHIADDGISFHVTSYSNPVQLVNFSATIDNNTLIDTYAIDSLGATNVTVSNNVIRRYKNQAIAVTWAQPVTNGGGTNSSVAVTITGNVMTDGIDSGQLYSSPTPGAVYAMLIGSGTPYVASGATAAFNTTGSAIVPPWQANTVSGSGGYSYATTQNFSSDGVQNTVANSARGYGVIVADNVAARTLSSTSSVSTWGFGPCIWLNNSCWSGAVPESALNRTLGVNVIAGLSYAQIHHNQFQTPVGIAFSGIAGLVSSGVLAPQILKQVDITDNTFWGSIESDYNPGSGAIPVDLKIERNEWNLNEFRANTAQGINGVWSGCSGPGFAVSLPFMNGIRTGYNGFRNTCQAYNLTQSSTRDGPDTYYGEFTGLGYAANKGDGNIPNGAADNFVFVHSDGTDPSTYGQIIFQPYQFGTAQPTTGSWVQQTFVTNTNQSVDGNGLVLQGWLRLTTSSTNSATPGVDWQPKYVKSTSP